MKLVKNVDSSYPICNIRMKINKINYKVQKGQYSLYFCCLVIFLLNDLCSAKILHDKITNRVFIAGDVNGYINLIDRTMSCHICLSSDMAKISIDTYMAVHIQYT